MKFYISFSAFDSKYFMYCISFLIVEIYLIFIIFYDETDENIINKHKLLDSSCLFFGFFLNIIPEWISNKKSNNNEYLSIKDIIIFFVLSFFIFITEFVKIIPLIINKDKNEKGYGDQFIFVEFLILFLIPHFSEIYYRHQNFSFLIFTLIEITKIIFFIFDKQFKDNLTVFLGIINSVIYAFYFINI